MASLARNSIAPIRRFEQQPGRLPAQPQPAPRKPRGAWIGWAVFIVFCCLMAVVARQIFTAVEQPAPAVAVRTVKVERGIVERTLRINGVTAPQKFSYLRAPYLGGLRTQHHTSDDFSLILEELAAPGSRVRKGDIVASFDRLSMENRLQDFRADQNDQENNVRSLFAWLTVKRTAHKQKILAAKSRMEKAALDLKTAPVRSAIVAEKLRLNLGEMQATYQEYVDQASLLDISELASIRRAELYLKQAQMERDRAETNMQLMLPKAPIDGIVFVEKVFRGTDFTPIQIGDQLHHGQTYMQIADPDSMIVLASANQVDIESIRLGARATLRFDGIPDLELPAHINGISPLAECKGRQAYHIRTVPVRLKLDGRDRRVIPSLTVSADVVLGSEESNGVIPLEAVFREETTGRPFAYVETGEGWERRELTLGLANNVDVAVRTGLVEGDVVAAGVIPEGL